MKIEKFGKFKKRKTRVIKPSDPNYEYIPASNTGSPAPGLSVPIVQMKVESSEIDESKTIEIEKTIKDYLSNIIDDGFDVSVDIHSLRFGIEFSILIRRYGKKSKFRYSDIKGDIERMIDLMDIEITQVDTDYQSPSSIDDISDSPFSIIEIHFIKH